MRENYTKETAETDEKMSYISSLDTLLAYTVGVTDTSSSSVTRSHCVVVLERPRLIACPQGVAISTVFMLKTSLSIVLTASDQKPQKSLKM